MPSRNVDLDRFVDEGVTSGRFSDASEVVREGVRLLERREQEDKAKLEWLRAAAKEGFDALSSGDYVTLNSEEDLDAFLNQIYDEVSSEVTAQVEVSGPARRDMAAILEGSFRGFGSAEQRYRP